MNSFASHQKRSYPMPLVGVIGEREASSENSLRAYTVGHLLAERGFAVLCGGLGGVMEAACRGACDAGGLTLGILPGTDAAEANPYVQIAIVTGLNEARNLLIVRSALALIAIGGEYGTLSEMAFALKMSKPVIALHSWQPERPGISHPTFHTAQTPEEAIEPPKTARPQGLVEANKPQRTPAKTSPSNPYEEDLASSNGLVRSASSMLSPYGRFMFYWVEGEAFISYNVNTMDIAAQNIMLRLVEAITRIVTVGFSPTS